nr:SDR family NAD(P)-dependent oxidoreductase [Angustibacter aerolatus]
MTDTQIALVTGGNRGLGRSAVLALAAAGTDVVLTYRSGADQAQEVVAAVQALGRTAVALQARHHRGRDVRRLRGRRPRRAAGALGPHRPRRPAEQRRRRGPHADGRHHRRRRPAPLRRALQGRLPADPGDAAAAGGRRAHPERLDRPDPVHRRCRPVLGVRVDEGRRRGAHPLPGRRAWARAASR